MYFPAQKLKKTNKKTNINFDNFMFIHNLDRL